MDSNSNSLLAIISALTALAAVFVGPMVTLMVSKKTIISPMRQKWIDNLRDSIAEILSDTDKGAYLSHISDKNDKMKIKRQEICEHLSYIKSKISLMINPDEANHNELLEAITALINAEKLTLEECEELVDGEPTDIEKKRQAVVKISRTILKEEWEVVKFG